MTWGWYDPYPGLSRVSICLTKVYKMITPDMLVVKLGNMLFGHVNRIKVTWKRNDNPLSNKIRCRIMSSEHKSLVHDMLHKRLLWTCTHVMILDQGHLLTMSRSLKKLFLYRSYIFIETLYMHSWLQELPLTNLPSKWFMTSQSCKI